ncbi:hypothetical protein CTI12_AA579230 [Artemisia annua]|uniref:Uncharacterized protein n=1 Tax=Artemisia annua TaxID=35608 RepID=A0A2U1KQD0_ARTAN|nr:hypothetical protein CTI12_AA579230 [Artemisia annua]
MEGVKVGRTAEEAEKIYSSSKKVNREAPAVWKAEFNKVFALEFPFIKKIADSHRLPLGDLMNIFPDSPTPFGLLSAPSPTAEAPPSHTAERNANAFYVCKHSSIRSEIITRASKLVSASETVMTARASEAKLSLGHPNYFGHPKRL